MPGPSRSVTHADDRFQRWHSLLDNRKTRSRTRRFLVHGVRPIDQALGHDWPIPDVLVRAGGPLSAWARATVDTARSAGAAVFDVAPDLLAELGQHGQTTPELVAVAELPADALTRIRPVHGLVLVLDRPSSPGNIGSLIRSADAFAADGVVICGHAADPYDPTAVRASTGSLFAVPVVRVDAPAPVLEWARAHGLRLVGTDETGHRVDQVDLTRPAALVIGNETRGMSTAWRAATDVTAAIPIGGSASSLNAANAGSIVLYEAARQRKTHH